MEPGRLTELLVLCILGCIKLVSGDKCSADAMSRCTDPLRVVTDNKDLGFATSQEELEEMCPKLMDGLRCIDNFTTKCLEAEHRAYFNTLYTGTTQVIVDLCQKGEYQTEYLEHAPCMRKAQTEYESCADEYQLRIKTLNKVTLAAYFIFHFGDWEFLYEFLFNCKIKGEKFTNKKEFNYIHP